MIRSSLGVVIAMMTLATTAEAQVDIKRWNPEGLSQPDGYSQLVTVEGQGKLVLLGGKAGITADGHIPDTLEEQSQLTWDNIDIALKAAGATREDVIEIQIYIVDLANANPEPAYQHVRDFFPKGHKPVSMVIGVDALAYPELKIEINVRAIVAQK